MWTIGLVLAFTAAACSQRTYDLVLEKMEKVLVDPEHVGAGTLRVTRMNRTHTVITGDFELFEEVDDDVKVTILTYEQLGTEYKRSAGVSLIDKKLCEFINSEKLGASDFKDATNLPRNCPIPPGKYSVNNYLLNPERFPQHIPGKKWRGDVFVKKDDITWAHVQVFLHIDRKVPMMG